MRTQDVLKMGIDRNFLRQCEKQSLIKPPKAYSEWIIHDEYAPKEYSQEDVEIVWHAYLCRKMGLSYDEIRKITQGEQISLRVSIGELINEYEEQIQELKAIIDFMKYVKGLGFVPIPKDVLIGGKSFKDYLVGFMEEFDETQDMKKGLSLAEYISQLNNIEEVENFENCEMEKVANELIAKFDKEKAENFTNALLEIKTKTHLDTASEETQHVIHKIYECQKKLVNDDNFPVWDFGINFIESLFYDSDLREMCKKLLGEKTVDYLRRALIDFLAIKEPEKIKEFCD